MGRKERVLEVACKIVQKREELAALMAQFDDLVGDVDGLVGGVDAPTASASEGIRAVIRTPVRLTVRDRIISQLERDPSREYSVQEVVGLIGGDANTVRSVLSRLAKNGELLCVKRGVYRGLDAETKKLLS